MTRIPDEILKSAQSKVDECCHGFKAVAPLDFHPTGINRSTLFELAPDQSFEMRVHCYERDEVNIERVSGPGLIEVNFWDDGELFRVYGVVGLFEGQTAAYQLSET